MDPKTVLMPLPHYGFDPTESAVPWRALVRAGHHVVFATPDGEPAQADHRMVTGKGLPKLPRKSLMARADDVLVYRDLEGADAVRRPTRDDEIPPDEYDG